MGWSSALNQLGASNLLISKSIAYKQPGFTAEYLSVWTPLNKPVCDKCSFGWVTCEHLTGPGKLKKLASLLVWPVNIIPSFQPGIYSHPFNRFGQFQVHWKISIYLLSVGLEWNLVSHFTSSLYQNFFFLTWIKIHGRPHFHILFEVEYSPEPSANIVIMLVKWLDCNYVWVCVECRVGPLITGGMAGLRGAMETWLLHGGVEKQAVTPVQFL